MKMMNNKVTYAVLEVLILLHVVAVSSVVIEAANNSNCIDENYLHCAGTGMEVVLHEDKKYYPTHEEVYGPDVEVSMMVILHLKAILNQNAHTAQKLDCKTAKCCFPLLVLLCAPCEKNAQSSV